MRTRIPRRIPVAAVVALATLTIPSAAARARLDSGVAGLGTAPRLLSAAPAAAPARVLAALAIDPIDLCAKAGTLTLPGRLTVPIWGFATKPTGVDCSDGSVQASVPGPVLDVNAGDAVTVNVTNALAEPIALDFPGIAVDPGPVEAAPGATVSYSFTASAPGTYLYESFANGGRQAAMGLAGALIVRPATAGRAYDDPTTAYDREAVMVLGEIDPAFNANPTSFDLRRWSPTYWLIDGKAYPDTDAIAAQPGDRVLLRYVNAGVEHATMTTLGVHQRLVARDAYPLGNPFDVVAETFPPGETADAIVTIPAGAAPGDRFPLYNRQLHLVNGRFGDPQYSPGGMLTFLTVVGP